MFDDQPKTNTTPQANQKAPANLPTSDSSIAQTPEQGSAPGEKPLSNEIPQSSPAPQPASNEPEDILESAEHDQSKNNQLEKPSFKVPQPSPDSFRNQPDSQTARQPDSQTARQPDSQTARQPDDPAHEKQSVKTQISSLNPTEALSKFKIKGFLGRKMLVVFLSLFILSLLVVAGLLLYKIFVAEPEPVNFIEERPQIIEPEPVVEVEEPEEPEPEPPAVEVAPPEETLPPEVEVPEIPEEPREVILDTDQDGLSDEEELRLGTNPRVIDTDFDGLTDWEEVEIYKSDPALKDTDGDGYFDGDEVESGYNPVGKGKLIK